MWFASFIAQVILSCSIIYVYMDLHFHLDNLPDSKIIIEKNTLIFEYSENDFCTFNCDLKNSFLKRSFLFQLLDEVSRLESQL